MCTISSLLLYLPLLLPNQQKRKSFSITTNDLTPQTPPPPGAPKHIISSLSSPFHPFLSLFFSPAPSIQIPINFFPSTDCLLFLWNLLRPLSMADMFWNMKKKSGLEMAIWSAKTAFLLVAFASTVVFASLAVVPSLGLLLSSQRSLWIAVQLIIVAIWKLSDVKPHGDQPHHPEVPVATPPDPPETWYDVPSSPTTSTASSPEFKSSPQPEHVAPPETSVTEEEASSPDDGNNDSMDTIWRAVMEGGGSPAKPVLRKSGTWERRQNVEVVAEEAVARREMSKSKTFKQKAEGWRRRDALVVVQDELFLRVETLIKKHHEHLRLQRQESEQRRFMERLRHGY